MESNPFHPTPPFSPNTCPDRVLEGVAQVLDAQNNAIPSTAPLHLWTIGGPSGEIRELHLFILEKKSGVRRFLCWLESPEMRGYNFLANSTPSTVHPLEVINALLSAN
jgi:hypothetical protein